jgi:alpha-glucosidase (family GH31 glycosyl hydrolase)
MSENKMLNIDFASGLKLRLEPCTNEIVRIRASVDGSFKESLLERYQIIKTDWSDFDYKTQANGDEIELRTSQFTMSVNRQNGIISVAGSSGKPLIKEIRLYPSERTQNSDNLKVLEGEQPKGWTPNFGVQTLVCPLEQAACGSDSDCGGLPESLQKYFCAKKPDGVIIGDTANPGEMHKTEAVKTEAVKENFSIAELSINEGVRFYGGGSASRTQIQHRGSALQFWATYQKSEAPMPFLVCSEGWGVFHNTTTRNYMDVGRFRQDNLYLVDTDSGLDFYLIVADDMAGVIEAYTSLTGKPYLLPKWAYGLAFGGNHLENQFDTLDNALRFRQEQIPCDIYWLEPQWMETHYDLSTKKKWNESRFQVDYHWLPDQKDPKRSNLFVNRMKELGFKTALWLCANHDLSIEEEDHLATSKGQPQSGQEHWFDHLRKFIDHGVAGFKLDPGRTINEHPERQYHNGRGDAEMHNLNQVLLLKQMCRTFRDHTGKRGFHHYCGAYAGSQHWGAMTVGDNGGGPKTLFDILNHAFCGNTNMAIDALEDVAVKGPAIHYTFFTPWIQLNSWAWMLHPWYYNEHDKEMFRFYAQLRYSLIPYIYSAAIQATVSGIPIIRPMALAYPDDRNLDECVNQFMFGENILVGAFTDTVYLPEGNWIDYWTGIKYAGKQTLKCNIPENRGGPLFIRSGAIIPCQKPVQYIGDQPTETIILKVYPEGQSSYTLLEDDGISFNYETGAIAATKFDCHAEGNKMELTIHATRGSYKGMPKERIYELEIAMSAKPQHISLNGMPVDKWEYDEKGILRLSRTAISTTVRFHMCLSPD